MESSQHDVSTKRGWSTSTLAYNIPLAPDVAIERMVRQLDSSTRHLDPDGIADESADWTYRKSLFSCISRRRVDEQGITTQFFLKAGRHIWHWGNSRYQVTAVSDDQSQLAVTITRGTLWCGLLYHVAQSAIFMLWLRGLRRETHLEITQRRRGVIQLMAFTLLMAIVVAVEFGILAVATHLTHGAAVVLLASMIVVGALSVLRSSTSAVTAGARTMLISGVFAALSAWCIRVIPHSTWAPMVGDFAVACLLASSVSVALLSLLRRRFVTGLLTLPIVALTLAFAPAVVGRSLGPLNVAPKPIREFALRGYPHEYQYYWDPVDSSPNTLT